MTPTITLAGIDAAMGSLNYANPNALKYRLLHAIRGQYQDDKDILQYQSIDRDALIPHIWDTGKDPQKIRARRKNLSSLRSSLNADLKKSFDAGRNPEGVTISENFTFTMSSEAKDKVLGTFADSLGGTGSMTIEQISDVLTSINEVLKKIHSDDPTHRQEHLGRIRDVLDRIREHVDAPATDSDTTPASGETASPEMADGDLGATESNEPGNADQKGTPRGIEGENTGGNAIDSVDSKDGEALGDVAFEGVDNDEIETFGDDAAFENLDPAKIEVAEADATFEDVEDADIEVPQEDALFEDVEDADIELAQEDALFEDVEDADIELALEDALFEDLDDADIEVPQEDATFEDVEDADIELALEDALFEDVEDADIEVAQEDAEIETVDDADVETIDEEDIEEVEEGDDVGLPVDLTGDNQDLHPNMTDYERNRLLSEQFDGYLGAMERYYNQYLEVPGGDYTIGSTDPGPDELPINLAPLAGGFMGKYPVTNALFEVFIDRTGYRTTAERRGWSQVYTARTAREQNPFTGKETLIHRAGASSTRVNGACWFQPQGPGSNLHGKRNHPVVHVTLEDAAAFAAWVGKRLPLETEWEAYARTPERNLYPWGDEMAPSLCNLSPNPQGSTLPVDAFPKAENGFLIADLLGNVWEWTATDAPSPRGSANTAAYAVIRGGAFVSSARTRLTTRQICRYDAASNILGFRCIIDA